MNENTKIPDCSRCRGSGYVAKGFYTGRCGNCGGTGKAEYHSDIGVVDLDFMKELEKL